MNKPQNRQIPYDLFFDVYKLMYKLDDIYIDDDVKLLTESILKQMNDKIKAIEKRNNYINKNT